MSVSRKEMFHRLGLINVVDPIVQKACEEYEQKAWEQGLDSSPHGFPWHTSFHASSFPGDDPKPCGRKAIYELMDVPSEGPLDPAVRAMGNVGKYLELELVKIWQEAGILLSTDGDEYQTGFVFPTYWLTGNTDAIILPPGWNRPHVVEVKGKDDDVVTKMRMGVRSYDEEHRRQLLAYIAGFHWYSSIFWPDLEPVTSGSLYYVSRSRPRNTMEYYFDLDTEFFEQGLKKIQEWQLDYIAGILPARDKAWKWTETPCKWCKFKKHVCKPDYKAKIGSIEDSHAIEYSKSVNPNYSYEDRRAKVLERWTDGSKSS